MQSPPLDPPLRTPTPRTPALTAAVLTVPSVLLLLLVAFSWRPLLVLDGDIARTTHRWAVDEPGATQVFRVLTDWVWDPWTMRALGALVVLLLVWRRSAWWPALWVTAACVLGTVVQQSLKAAVGRARPVWPDPVDSAHYAAFPSGHAMTATVVCGLLLWLLQLYGAGRALRRTALALAVVSVVGVGLTRVWLGVHWPSDVLGGWLLGALVVALAVMTHERLFGSERT
ncbi:MULTISPECIES: phosphatase PAP2 family protein [Streptomyces]|uniref:Phosphatase PAP2 family protein n=1 Tax=Streptomyces mirabilis TaxID=68239 RepID=A0ABU3UZJ3_9ACTN|nr:MULTISPECIES: phosphatase PAP2 family protein [Streptomyces]MDU8999348.1 phosphatase PAP2 family protein [Streptomyces mirabilis]NMI56476.1 phosphatase PAP2 family protein [Streptomyces sp. RLA2-12]QDN55896.1 phosphatase PAP2 family protein [Streptomyces sp. S1D4-20]QDN66073.1 phosphatase PAP2 family protein [Streptomyces sp. S1D4-14]QDO48481.1 phosphatase PAP2 family protein [Streptomyces sp. RLB3-5]